MDSQRTIIISVSSDIGMVLANRWLEDDQKIFGTYRTETNLLKKLKVKGAQVVKCDLSDLNSINDACKKITELCNTWDNLIFATGTLNPIGNFQGIDFAEWENSLSVNFTNQLRILHYLLPYRNLKNPLGACVLFFAGGGTNNATVNYSSYTISKIALIKMCELLDAEIVDARFSILGPGWVRTKIHNETLEAGSKAGKNLEKTKYMLSEGKCTSIEDIIESCEWVINSPREVISGRNFSTVSDAWGTEKLEQELTKNRDLFKLRRYGNNILTGVKTE